VCVVKDTARLFVGRDTGEPTMHGSTLPELRKLARSRIRSGDLPCTEAPRVWAGRGAGESCGVCPDDITSQQTAYEVEVRADGIVVQSIFFHRLCHTAWQLECDDQPQVSTG
jgi:hypothetical protein